MPSPTQTEYRLPLQQISNSGLIEISVPIPLGYTDTLDHIYVECNGHSVSCGAKVLTRWHNQSINWIHIILCERFEEDSVCNLVVDNSRKPNEGSDGTLSLQKENSLIGVTNGYYHCQLNPEALSLEVYSLKTNNTNKTLLCHQSIELRGSSNSRYDWFTESVRTDSYISLINGTTIATRVIIAGYGCSNESGEQVRFSTVVSFFGFISSIKYEFSIHNPNAAQHPNGQWDLGDNGSFFFDSLKINFTSPRDQIYSYQTKLSDAWVSANGQKTEIRQHSSGGENWQSPVHVSNTNTVTHVIKGFEHVIDDKVCSLGERATPTIATETYSLTLEQFWQNFPKSISIQPQKVILALYPKLSAGQHELQGGEKKTHSFWIGTQGSKKELSWVHQPRQIYFVGDNSFFGDSIYGFNSANSNKTLSSLIEHGLRGEGCFFDKREMLDEYGWRNFGDLYADHETAGHDGDHIFVSHYNNQYDPIYGFLKQYLTTGNQEWFELANDLAKHVKDIDIYHTDLDKNEYNGGLFWHTDHYLEAFTSSHRSYSKYQSGDAYQDHAGGGGPGGQHCYTTGLKLHYCITGEESSKQAVITLAHWISNVYEGSGTFFELLLAFKNRHDVGLKNHFTGQYPLDRGIANYIVALLDRYELCNDEQDLYRVGSILKSTIHPTEDLEKRNLNDVETTWFYTVLLQALCRYLDIKQLRQELDDNFYYCRDCLLHFADWMAIHEYPYLEKPDILEYPNDTWTAQDLRKAHIFAAAYYYSNKKVDIYLEKALFFEQYVATKLNSSDTKTYTRVLVLLMQNHGAVDFYKLRDCGELFEKRKLSWPVAEYQKTSVLQGLFREIFKRLKKLSIKNELNWLKTRLS